MRAAIAVATGAVNQRWRELAMVVALTAIIVGVALSLAGGARRTVSTVDRLRRTSLAADLLVQPDPVDHRVEQLRAHTGVAAVGQRGVAYVRVRGSDVDLGSQVVAAVAVHASYGRTIDRPILLAGSFPDSRDPHEVLLTEAGADAYDVGPGDELVLESLTPPQVEQLVFQGKRVASFDGPVVTVKVAGVGRTVDEALGRGGDHFILTPAFWQRYRADIGGFDNILLVRVQEGASLDAVGEAARQLWVDDDELFVDPTAAHASGIEDLVRAEAIALLIVGALVVLAGVVILSQALSRSADELTADAPALAALGMTRGQRLLAAASPLFAAGLIGAVIGAIGTALASGAFPTGRAADIEPSPGLRMDATLLAGGIMVTALFFGGAASALVLRADRTPARFGTVSAVARMAARGPAVVSAAAHLVARRGVPVRSGVAAAVVALAGTVAALIFGASLHRFVSDPAQDGWNWDTRIGVGADLDDEAARSIAEELARQAGVREVAVVRQRSFRFAGREVQLYGVESVRGKVDLTVLAGRPPAAPDEVALGSHTAERVGAHLGDRIELDGSNGVVRQYRVTAVVRFPNIGRDTPADGIAMTLDALEDLAPVDPADGGGFADLLVRWEPGTDGAGVLEDFTEDFTSVSTGDPSSEVVMLGEARSAPPLLIAVLGVLGLAALAHALAMAVVHARHDLGVLAALGFDRLQRRGVVFVQAAGYLLAGLGLGIPLGLAAGRWSWILLADRLGIDPNPSVPTSAVLLIPVAVALVFTVALLPARLAHRVPAASVLRAE